MQQKHHQQTDRQTRGGEKMEEEVEVEMEREPHGFYLNDGATALGGRLHCTWVFVVAPVEPSSGWTLSRGPTLNE
jgi:hypothetical protein